MVFSIILGSLTLAGGLGGFVYYLIQFIQSYTVETGEWGTQVSSDQDLMVIFFLFLMIAIVGFSTLFGAIRKKKSMMKGYTLEISIVGLISAIYGLARLLKAYNKNKPTEDYWIWLAISLAVLALFMIWNNVLLRLVKKENPAKNPEILANPEENEVNKEPESEAAPEEETSLEGEETPKKEETPEPVKEIKEPEVIDVYTIPHKRFRIRMEHNPNIIMSFDTKEEALEFARQLAAQKKTNVTIK